MIEDIKNDIGGDKVNDLVEFSLKIINFLLFLFKVLNKDFFIYFFKNFFKLMGYYLILCHY